MLVAAAAVLTSCWAASEHRAAVTDDTADRVTVGTVQREIRVGMTNTAVIEALGSPNVVTTDDERREVWVYDKISTERVYSRDYGGVSALVLGFGGSSGTGGAGAATGAYNAESGAESTRQRTLTIVIKYDEASKVRDFAYRTSSF